MGVLALHVGADARLAVLIVVQAALARIAHGVEVAIHGAGDVGPGAVALIVGEARLVEGLDGILHGLEVVAAAALVAVGPEQDAGLVAQPQHLALVALHHGGLELLVAAERRVAVALYVGLGQHVDAELVAEVVEVGVVGIVARADGIDIEALHHQQVLLRLLVGHGASALGAEVVAVHAVEDDALAVDQQGAVGTHRHLTQAHLAAAHVKHLVAVLQSDDEGVELRLLGVPQARVGDAQAAQRDLSRRGDAHALLGHDGAAVHNLRLHGAIGKGGTLHVDDDAVGGHCIVATEGGGEEVVADLRLRSRPKEHVARDARQAPVVLALQERAAGEAIHAHGYIIGSRAHVLCNIKVRGQVAVLGIAYKLSVHPDVVAVSGTIEAHVDVAVVPPGRQGELAAIGANGVFLRAAVGPVGWAVGHDTPRIGVIGEGI